MNRKTATTAFVLSLFVISAFSGLQAVEPAEANPYGMLLSVWKDKIAVNSPQNTTSYKVGPIPVDFTIEYLENQTAARYILNNELVYIMPNTVTTRTGEGYTYTPSTNQNTTFTVTRYIGQYSFPLQNLTEGTYNLTIQRSRCSASVIFTIDKTPPKIAIMSPQNTTYPPTGIPLNFTVNESTSWVGYSINNQANVTLTGNSALRVQGLDLLVIYANDTAGNMGKSKAIFFEVGPNPYLPSNPPPTEQPTLEPSLTASPTEPMDSLKPLPCSPIITVAFVIIATTVAVGLLVYLAKHKGVR